MKRALALVPLMALALAGCSSGESGAEVNPVAACGFGDTHAAIITSLGFTREKPMGVTPGFNLDGEVSDGKDKSKCLEKEDTVSPDGTPGIDNQVARLVPTVEVVYGNAIDGLVQGAINNGELEILLEMAGVSDFANDDCVNLGVSVGKGAVALGTDGVIEGYQTFDSDAKSPHSVFERAAIVDSTLEAGPFELAVPIAIFDVSFILHFHGARFRFTVDPEGNLDGLFGGAIKVQELLDGVKQGAGVANSIKLIEIVLKGSADMGVDSERQCHQISVALAFKAAPAFIR